MGYTQRMATEREFSETSAKFFLLYSLHNSQKKWEDEMWKKLTNGSYWRNSFLFSLE